MVKILCVDDTLDIRTLVRATLMRDGIQVILAANGAEGLDSAARERPDGILLDINMPIMDGIETLRHLAASPELAAIPVMMITSESQASNVRTAIGLGARDFVVKPFEPEALRQRVRRLLATNPTPMTTSTGPPLSPAPIVTVPTGAAKPTFSVAPRVLVVDDLPSNLVIAREMLVDIFDVVTAQSGAGALLAAADERPEIVLVDLEMPVMDGLETAIRLRRQTGLAPERILIASTDPSASARARAVAGTFLRKPLQRRTLLGVIANALSTNGHFSFGVRSDIVVLRFYGSAHWGQDVPSGAGETPTHQRRDLDLDEVADRVETVFGRMLETGHRYLAIDFDAWVAATEVHTTSAVEAVRRVLARAAECRLETRVVAPYRLRGQIDPVVQSTGVSTAVNLGDALIALRRLSVRQLGQA